MVDVVEVSYRVVKVKQRKYACKCGGCVETAPGPERAVSGGRYSLDFAIKVAIDKYLDHIPLARQERIVTKVYTFKLDRICRSGVADVFAFVSELRRAGCTLFAIADNVVIKPNGDDVVSDDTLSATDVVFRRTRRSSDTS